MKKTIIITGIHHTPGIELIHLLKEDKRFDWNIHYVSHLTLQETHLSFSIIPKLNITFHQLESGKFHRTSFLNTLSGIPKIFSGIYKSLNIINQIHPDLVVSFGGYISFPLIIAAKFKHIPVIIHEQTLTNSLTTKLSSLFVNKIALSFNNPSQINGLPKSKTIVTGNLIRREIYYTKSSYYQNLNISLNKKPIIYITGGNQGSSVINTSFKKLLPKLSDFSIIHQTGKADYPQFRDISKKLLNYYPTPYVNLEDIGWVLHHSEIIISRSGANISQEIILLAKKAILIPLPFTQQNEQELHAMWVKKLHPETICVIPQSRLTASKLLDCINYLIKVNNKYPQTEYQSKHPFIKLIHEMV